MMDSHRPALTKLAIVTMNSHQLWGMLREPIKQYAMSPKMDTCIFKYVFWMLINYTDWATLLLQFPKDDETLGYIFVYAALLQRYDKDPELATLG